MKSYTIKQKRINKLNIPKEYDIHKIQIGIPVYTDEAKKVGLFESGDVVLPSGEFGGWSHKNAYGYTFPDKTKPKERRYVNTVCSYPYGNTNAGMCFADIYKKCYPRVFVQPFGIELQLFVNEEGKEFVIANMTDEIRNVYLKETINLFLEIYGICHVFEEEICIDNSLRTKKCNWVILPPGEMPSKFIKKGLAERKESVNAFSILRLEYIEGFNPEKVVEGINGFKGYYAYVFENYCVLESAMYGNATYVIPKENWETLSQMTKQQLFDVDKVVARVEHRKIWSHKVSKVFKELGIFC